MSKETKVCELCEEEVDELFTCEACGKEVCNYCSDYVSRNIFCTKCLEKNTDVFYKMENACKNKLDEKVLSMIKDHFEPAEGSLKNWFKDLFYGGCQSGFIGDLIYYSDTLKFYNDYKEDINKLLYEMLESFGSKEGGPEHIFGEKWDKSDPLVIETSNQNLLAWFAFEETARKFSDALGFDL